MGYGSADLAIETHPDEQGLNKHGGTHVITVSMRRVILSLGRAKSAQERNSSIFKRETFYRREIAIYGNLSSQIIVEVTVT